MTTHDEHAERTVLGAMLSEGRELTKGLELSPSSFSLDSHRRIFTRIRTMHAVNASIDIGTLAAELKRAGEIDAVGGLGYVMGLTELLPSRLDVTPHIKTLRKLEQSRNVIALCDQTRTRIEDGEDPEDVLGDFTTRQRVIQMESSELRPMALAECVVPFLEEMAEQRAYVGGVLGVTTGIDDLDQAMTGWRNGELSYIGALPGRGKSAFMLQGMYAAARQGVRVGCISLEMRRNQLVRRLAVMHSGLHAQKFRDPRRMTPEEYQAAKKAAYSLGDLPISIVDQSGLRPAQIANVARKMHEQGARIIYLDFVQIVVEDGRDRREAINRVSASLRDTCKELNIPFVVLSQLARRDADPNRKPTLQDLRESGNLEQDCHNCLMLYRPKDRNTLEWTGQDEIIVEKAREGMMGIVAVTYDSRLLRFGPRPKPELVSENRY